jgi:hypothetical protein
LDAPLDFEAFFDDPDDLEPFFGDVEFDEADDLLDFFPPLPEALPPDFDRLEGAPSVVLERLRIDF